MHFLFEVAGCTPLFHFLKKNLKTRKLSPGSVCFVCCEGWRRAARTNWDRWRDVFQQWTQPDRRVRFSPIATLRTGLAYLEIFRPAAWALHEAIIAYSWFEDKGLQSFRPLFAQPSVPNFALFPIDCTERGPSRHGLHGTRTAHITSCKRKRDQESCQHDHYCHTFHTVLLSTSQTTEGSRANADRYRSADLEAQQADLRDQRAGPKPSSSPQAARSRSAGGPPR